MLINEEQQSKERDTEKKLYQIKNNPKFFIPGPSINDQLSSISINKEDESDNKEINQNAKKKLKFPINLKLNQSQMVQKLFIIIILIIIIIIVEKEILQDQYI